MASCNSIHLLGNLTRDPEVRRLPSGAPVCTFGLAVSEVYKNKNGEQNQTTCFVDIQAWDRQAESCGEYLAKGSLVFVEGRLRYETWDGDDGAKRSKHVVRAHRVQFLGRPAREAGREAAEPAVAAGTGKADDLPF